MGAVLLRDAVMPEMLERREVEKHHDEQHLAGTQLARSAAFPAFREKVMSFPVFQGLRKIIATAEDCAGRQQHDGDRSCCSRCHPESCRSWFDKTLSPISLSRIGVWAIDEGRSYEARIAEDRSEKVFRDVFPVGSSWRTMSI